MLIYETPKSSIFLHQYPNHKVTEQKQDIFASTYVIYKHVEAAKHSHPFFSSEVAEDTQHC